MLNIDSLKLGPIPKIMLILGTWGIAILIGGIVQQNMKDPTPTQILIMWAIVTAVGLVGQALGLCRGLEWNFTIWVVAIGLAWAFTLFVFQIYQPKSDSDPILYLDLGPVWLGLIGIALLVTGFQVNRIFWLLGILHLIAALFMELSSRNILKWSYLDDNQAWLTGVIDGGLLLIVALGWLVTNLRPNKPSKTTS
jgi:hypothetical protein